MMEYVLSIWGTVPGLQLDNSHVNPDRDSSNSGTQSPWVCSIINYRFNEAVSTKWTHLICPRLKLSLGCSNDTLIHR